MSIEARKYWINFFTKQAFDRRYAAYRGMDDHQRTIALAKHLEHFFEFAQKLNEECEAQAS
jgi:hypothetical protein